MIRLFFDANVLFTAAHNPDGKAALILALGAKGEWEVVSSTYAVEEARRNIERKFPLRALALEELLLSLTIVPSGTGKDCPLELPVKDRPIFESALRVNATHLLTGDLKDFGAFMNKRKMTRGVLIQTVSSFLDSNVQDS